MRVLITGGAGFIGRHLTRHFSEQGASVTVLDDLSSGSLDALPSEIDFIEADVSDEGTCELMRDRQPEVVIHAAAQVSVTRSVLDPAFDQLVNVTGTANVVDGATAAESRIVFLSSGGAIYGEAALAREVDQPSPLSPYGRNKLRAEEIVASAGLPYAIARLANVYGPGQRADLEGGVVAVFAEAARSGAPLTIYGDGEQSRDFVHVHDVVRAVATMALVPRDGVWNVGTGVATTVNDLAALTEASVGRALGRDYRPARNGEVHRSCLSVEKASVELRWQPAVSIEEGVRQLLAS